MPAINRPPMGRHVIKVLPREGEGSDKMAPINAGFTCCCAFFRPRLDPVMNLKYSVSCDPARDPKAGLIRPPIKYVNIVCVNFSFGIHRVRLRLTRTRISFRNV